jgi:hypothetical protein
MRSTCDGADPRGAARTPRARALYGGSPRPRNASSSDGATLWAQVIPGMGT